MAADVPSLTDLKENVTEAVEEIKRLRVENRQLSESLQTLWANSDEPVRGASVMFTEDRDELRERLQRYIAIIDRHLNQNGRASNAG